MALGEGGDGPGLTKAQAISLQLELLERFRSREFKRELKRMEAREGRGTPGMAAALAELCLPEQAAVLPSYGLEAGPRGLSELSAALRLLELDDEVLLSTNRVRVCLGLPARKRAAVQRAAMQDRDDGSGVFDWGSLDVCEEEAIKQTPSSHIIGGKTCNVWQRRLPDSADPESTGLQVWPSAVALARFFESAATSCGPESPVGRSVLELGAGVGLVSLAALALGAKRVVATDVARALKGLHHSLRMNDWLDGLSGTLEAEELDWRVAAAGGPVPTGQFDVVCWADCVFWPALFEPLLATLFRLATMRTVVLFSLNNRGQLPGAFLELLGRHFRVREVWRTLADRGRGADLRIYRASRR